MKREGRLIVLSSPSGGGKTTISDGLLKQDRQVVRSVSATTRLPRGREKQGKDYYFMSESRFRQLLGQGRFLESANVHGHYYGTLLQEVKKHQQQGKDVLLVIDVQGGLAVRKIDPQVVLIFVKPPNFKALERRLRGRGTDAQRTIRERLKNARWEMSFADAYDYVVTNKEVKRAVADVQAIITAERLRVLQPQGKKRKSADALKRKI